MGIEEKVCNN